MFNFVFYFELFHELRIFLRAINGNLVWILRSKLCHKSFHCCVFLHNYVLESFIIWRFCMVFVKYFMEFIFELSILLFDFPLSLFRIHPNSSTYNDLKETNENDAHSITIKSEFDIDFGFFWNREKHAAFTFYSTAQLTSHTPVIYDRITFRYHVFIWYFNYILSLF